MRNWLGARNTQLGARSPEIKSRVELATGRRRLRHILPIPRRFGALACRFPSSTHSQRRRGKSASPHAGENQPGWSGQLSTVEQRPNDTASTSRPASAVRDTRRQGSAEICPEAVVRPNGSEDRYHPRAAHGKLPGPSWPLSGSLVSAEPGLASISCRRRATTQAQRSSSGHASAPPDVAIWLPCQSLYVWPVPFTRHAIRPFWLPA